MIHWSRSSRICLAALLIVGCGDDTGVTHPAADAGVDAPPDAVEETMEEAAADALVEVSEVGEDAPLDSSIDTPIDTPIDTQLSSTIHIPGLTAPVTVRTDDRGLKHLSCATDEDCMAAYGYVAASDNFMVMDLARRAARGRYSELGAVAEYEAYDADQKHFLATADGTPLEEAIWPKLRDDTRALIEAQTRGINAWLEDLKAGNNGAELAPEIVAAWPTVVTDMLPWEALDSVALSASGEQGETGNGLAMDASNAQYLDLLGPDYFRDLILGLPASDVSILGSQATVPTGGSVPVHKSQLGALTLTRSRLGAYGTVLSELVGRMERERALRELVARPHASNNWAVGAGRTAHGKSIVENDPHGALNMPSHIYAIEVDAVSEGTGTLHFFGTGLGELAIYIGRNEHIAWGLTTSGADLIDYYDETLVDDGTAVLFNGQHVPLIQKDIEIRQADGSITTVARTWVPHHGPLLAIDSLGTKGISARWVGHEANTDLDHWLDLMRAQSAQEALTIARRFEARGNNLVVGDLDGHVMWRPLVKIPKRPWAAEHPPYLPVPGDGTAEWDGYLTQAEIPELYDPPEGFVASANNDFTGAWYDGDPTNDATPYMQFWCSGGARAARIRDVLLSSQAHDADGMVELQMDSTIWLASQIMPDLLELADQSGAALSPEGQAVRDALADWQYTCPTGLDGIRRDSPDDTDPAARQESIGCSAYHALIHGLTDAIWLDDCATFGLTCQSGSFFDGLIHSLLNREAEMAVGEVFWDDQATPQVETAEEIVARGIEGAAELLVALRGTDVEQWRWGRVLYLKLQPVVDIGVSYPEQGPYAVCGGAESVNPVVPNRVADGFEHSYGAMLRMVVDLGVSGGDDFWQIPGGPGHHPSSPYFASFVEDYARGIPYSVPVGPAEVQAAAVETVTITAP